MVSSKNFSQKEQMKPYLDANIWIAYIWFHHCGGGVGKKRPPVTLVDELNEREILSPVTQFIIAEVSKHFSEWELFQKAIKDGFSFWQWKDVRKKYALDEKDKQKVEEVIVFLNGLDSANFVPNIKLSQESVELINALVLEDPFEFPDAVHVAMAVELNCDYFVTNDELLRELIAEKAPIPGISYPKVVRPTEFLNTYLKP